MWYHGATRQLPQTAIEIAEGMDTARRKRTPGILLLVALLTLVLVVSPTAIDATMRALDVKAFTLAPGVVCYRGDINLESGVGKALQRHEAVHQRQMREYGILRFWASYIRERLHLASEHSELEEEARTAEAEEWLACRYIDFGSKPPWSTDEGGLPWLGRNDADAWRSSALVP